MDYAYAEEKLTLLLRDLNCYTADEFRHPKGFTFTNYRSSQFIEFPWNEPDSQIIDVTEDDQGNTIYPDWIKPIKL